MYGQVIFHRRPDSSLKAAEVSFRLVLRHSQKIQRRVVQAFPLRRNRSDLGS